MVVGLMSLEVYKLIQGNKNIEYFKNSFINMAFLIFVFTEPVPAKRKNVDMFYLIKRVKTPVAFFYSISNMSLPCGIDFKRMVT